jgi:hypothetical protein
MIKDSSVLVLVITGFFIILENIKLDLLFLFLIGC